MFKLGSFTEFRSWRGHSRQRHSVCKAPGWGLGMRKHKDDKKTAHSEGLECCWKAVWWGLGWVRKAMSVLQGL